VSRSALARLALSIGVVIAAFLVWSLFYELMVALRFKPGMAGEGTSGWALLQYQAAQKSTSAFFVALAHFWERAIYPDTRGEALIRAALAAAGTAAAGGALALANVLLKRPTPYGDAKFGSLFDAEKKRLTTGKGLVLGRLSGATLTSNDPSHVLVVGPTRSGKGVSFVIPNGYMWQGSSVWFDPKRENFQALAPYRKELGDKVFVFSPGEKNTHRYNPLDFVTRDERMATDCLVVSSFLVPDDNKEIWARSARLMMAAMIGYVVSSPSCEGRRNLRSVAELTTTQADFQTVLKTIVKLEGAKLPQWVVDGFNQFAAIEPETRNSALFNVTTALGAWNNELVASSTAESDFDIRKFRRERMALFIGCSVAQLEIFRPILKLLIQQIHDQLMAATPGPDERHQVLMMIDEFRQLGRMDDLVAKLTINAGYGFRMCLILQDVSQLDELYGKAVRESTISACQVKLFIRINDQATSDYVSNMLGSRTEQLATATIRSGQGMFGRHDKSTHFIERPLRSPQELREMPETIAILLVPNARPFELKKIRHYADQPFARIAEANTFKHFAVPPVPPYVKAAPRPVDAEKVPALAPAPVPAPPSEDRPPRPQAPAVPEFRREKPAPVKQRKPVKIAPAAQPVSAAVQEEVSIDRLIAAAKAETQDGMQELLTLAEEFKLGLEERNTLQGLADEFEAAAAP
jgi:type IV secretion system protein VirD4